MVSVVVSLSKLLSLGVRVGSDECLLFTQTAGGIGIFPLAPVRTRCACPRVLHTHPYAGM
jgi:hypothetical protein